MNLRNKKELAARTFGVGTSRIVFVNSRINEIKEALTKQDIKDLVADGAIIVKPVKGRKTVKKTKSRSVGNVRKKVNKRKQNYMTLTRKLRKYVKELSKRGEISKEDFKNLRKKIRNKEFRDKSHFKSQLGGKENESRQKKKKRK